MNFYGVMDDWKHEVGISHTQPVAIVDDLTVPNFGGASELLDASRHIIFNVFRTALHGMR